MYQKTIVLAVAASVMTALPDAAQAHVSLHPNAIPAGSFVTTSIRVPNEEEHASTTGVAVKLPAGVLSALGTPPAGWKFSAKTKKLAEPIKTDDGPVTSETTEIDYSGGKILPGALESFPLTLSIPASASDGDVIAFPTVQTYSNGHVVRWIGDPASDRPAPTIDITAPGGALLDVTGGDAGPPAKLPAILTGTSAPATIVKKQNDSLAVIALIVGAVGLILGGTALATRRRTA